MSTGPEEIADWMRLLHAEGVGPVTARLLLSQFGLPSNIFAASHSSLTKVVTEPVASALLTPVSSELAQAIDATAQWSQQAGNHVITLADAAYPAALLDTADPPLLLYAKGDLSLLKRPALAMVGSRNASVQGMEDANLFARELSGAGVTVVSGLALGIDTAAHLGALDAGAGGGSTIAVIGTGADRVYPARNRSLAHRIAAEGLMLSEYPLGTSPIAANFPRRNRIISGLSRAVLVVEAAAQSGSLITARLALDQGRDVYAIPGSIHSPLSKGCHQLIKQGAKLVESAQDVLEELGPIGVRATARSAASESGSDANSVTPVDPDLQALLDTMGYDPVEINTLTQRAKLDASTIAEQLLMLEMQGLIEALPGARYRRLASGSKRA